jgi:HEAT repeat protein
VVEAKDRAAVEPAMSALADLKDPRGAAAVAHLLDDWNYRVKAADALQKMGKVASPDVAKYAFHPDAWTQGKARELLKGYGLTDSVLIDAALADLKDPEVRRRQGTLQWFAQARADEARRGDVSKALETAAHEDGLRESAFRAMKVWGTKENVPYLVEIATTKIREPNWIFIKGQTETALQALGAIGDDRAIEAVIPCFGNVFLGSLPQDTLAALGPKAEKGLIRQVNTPHDAARGEIRRLLQKYGTKTEVILPQIVTDLKDGDARHRQLAADYLEKLPAVEAKREEVSKALNFALDDPDGNVVGAGVRAAKTWGTKENVPALLKQVTDGGPFNGNRGAALEALVAIKDERAVWPIAGWLNDAFNGAAARGAVEKLGRVSEKVALAHLKDADGPSRARAWTVLSLVGTKGSVPAMKAAADKETDAGIRNGAASALRLAELRP